MLAIKYHGIDGVDLSEFKDIESVIRFLKPRDQGEDYRRAWGLQDDFARYAFEGFTWADLLEDGEYKDGGKPELEWEVKAEWHDLTDGSNDVLGSVYRVTHSNVWTVAVGDCCHKYLPSQESLEDAKELLVREISK